MTESKNYNLSIEVKQWGIQFEKNTTVDNEQLAQLLSEMKRLLNEQNEQNAQNAQNEQNEQNEQNAQIDSQKEQTDSQKEQTDSQKEQTDLQNKQNKKIAKDDKQNNKHNNKKTKLDWFIRDNLRTLYLDDTCYNWIKDNGLLRVERYLYEFSFMGHKYKLANVPPKKVKLLFKAVTELDALNKMSIFDWDKQTKLIEKVNGLGKVFLQISSGWSSKMKMKGGVIVMSENGLNYQKQFELQSKTVLYTALKKKYYVLDETDRSYRTKIFDLEKDLKKLVKQFKDNTIFTHEIRLYLFVSLFLNICFLFKSFYYV